MSTIAVIDYEMGNLRSVAKALEHVAPKARVVVTADAATLRAADRIVFPGQGAVRDCMAALRRGALIEPLREALATKPFLGICLGLQALPERSEENAGTDCLGWCEGQVRRFAPDLSDPETGARLKVPHMGWNTVRPTRAHPLWAGIAPDSRFYFVHSYYIDPADPGLVAATTHYGHDFACALARDNVFAVQFHPEKSQKVGLQLLANFAAWNGEPTAV